MEGAKTAPVDEAGSCHLAGTVYGGIIVPLPAKRHPRQQHDHLQRPAQIAEIMHFPPRGRICAVVLIPKMPSQEAVTRNKFPSSQIPGCSQDVPRIQIPGSQLGPRMCECLPD